MPPKALAKPSRWCVAMANANTCARGRARQRPMRSNAPHSCACSGSVIGGSIKTIGVGTNLCCPSACPSPVGMIRGSAMSDASESSDEWASISRVAIPNDKSVPSQHSATECASPAATDTICPHSTCTRVGTSTSSPYDFSSCAVVPPAVAAPSSSVAEEWIVEGPSPSLPHAVLPQAHRPPSCVAARVCSLPHAAITTTLRPNTLSPSPSMPPVMSVGFFLENLSPSPNCPELPLPQAHIRIYF
mmetsp:Transcript_12222/g.19354  ORF Transcript_12222/g.19354 Transcript_12222/m.19354 type:complete len:245 (-) Transcript_12222:226-960(-)